MGTQDEQLNSTREGFEPWNSELFGRHAKPQLIYFLIQYLKVIPRGAYRHNGEHGVGLCISEENVNEGDDLERFAQAHAVGQDAAEPAAAAETLHRLHQVVV